MKNNEEVPEDIVNEKMLSIGVLLLNIRLIQILGYFSKNFRTTLTIVA
jgi:hypothetical protein